MIRPDPRAKAPTPKFIPEIWKNRIIEPVYKKIAEKYPKLITSYEGEIQRQGDIVWFPDRYSSPYSHGLVADKTVNFAHVVDDPIYVQRDLNLMTITANDIAGGIVKVLDIPTGPGLFAGQITCLEDIPAFGIRGQLTYGHRSLNPIRLATEIIARCQREGLSHDKTIKELERFF